MKTSKNHAPDERVLPSYLRSSAQDPRLVSAHLQVPGASRAIEEDGLRLETVLHGRLGCNETRLRVLVEHGRV